MPITKTDDWQEWVDNNTDPYGKACVDVARRAMTILDDEPGEIDPYKLICRADDDIKAGGITGFMAGCVAQMISHCHSRGDEFRRAWNGEYGVKEDQEGVVNPAILKIG